MLYNNLYHTIRTSKNQYYRYYLNKNKSLIEETFDSSPHNTNILFNNVLDYSIEIANNDDLNIIHINNKGELYYSLFSSQRTNRKLAQIDLENYTLKFITLKLIASSPHIFYIIKKNSSSNWYLYHNFYSNGDWNSNEVAEIHSKKYISPYMTDSIDKDLYIFFQDDIDDNYVIKKLNMRLDAWEQIDLVSVSNGFNPIFMMDKAGTAFIYYNSFYEHNILTYVIYKNFRSETKDWSKPFLLSDPTKNSIRPSITIMDKVIHILWQDGNDISYVTTDMTGINILSRSTFHKKTERDTFKSFYLSSNTYDRDNKSNYAILAAIDDPTYIFDIKDKPKKERKNYAIIDDNAKNIVFSPAAGIRHMQLILAEKDKKLMQVISNYAKLKNNINAIINDKAKNLLNNKIFVPDTGKTEDELMLGKLNFLINSLSKEIYIRDEKINQLNTQLNKQLFKKLFHQ